MSHGEASTAATSGKCSNRTDPGWKYCSPVDEKLTSKVKCNFCNKEMNGGITRAKEHLMGKKGKVAPCPSCPKQVRDELWDHFQSKKNFGSSDFAKYTEFVDLGGTDSTSGIGNADEDATVVRGPMDAFMKRGAAASAGKLSKENMRQQNVKESLDKKAVALVHQDIARFWYHAGLSFNAIRLPYFDRMVKSIGEFGKNLPVPSYHDIRVPLLHKEMEHTEALLEKKKKVWTEVGCSIMSDGWSDRKQRSIINFLVNSPSGSVFIRSIDASGIVKTGEKIFEMLDSMVDEIGEENVVQVVTDNGSNYVAAGKLLMAKREHLYWTPCAAHCIDLMLEDIGKIAVIKNTIKRSISLVGYIYSHGFTLNLLRTTTNKKELVRPAITRFATSYLSLQRLQEERENLRKMFTCDEWMQNKLSKEAKGIEATKTVMKTSFWNNVVYILKIMGPLVRVLRMVDGEKKAAMGYIYEAIEKAKEAIKKSFNGIEKKYEDVFKIIDKRWSCQLHRPLHAAGYFLNPSIFYDNRELNFDSVVTKGLYACINRLATSKAEEDRVLQQLNVYTNAAGDFFGTEAAQRQRKIVHPATWWSMFGKDTRLLQKFAIKILSLTCSASGCERNWSVFEQIHTKKRNRLEHKRMQDLVYVKYNQKLHDRNKLSATDEFDPIILDDIDECNEWLVGELDDDDDIDGGNHLVHDDDDTLDWNMVYKASGVGEPRTYTRSKKRKESSTSSSSCLRVSKKKEPIIPRKGKGKRKRLALVDEESEEEEFEDSVSGDQEDEAMEDEDEMDADDSDDDELEDYVELDD